MSGTTKRAMFTINNPTFKDSEKLYQLGHNENTKYLVYGCEHDDGKPDHTPHYQGFIVFKKNVRCNTVCALLGGRAYVCFPKRTDPSLRMARYCQKEGFYMQFGSLSIAPGVDSSIKPSEMRQKAIEWLNNSDNLYTRMRDIPPDLLMTPGFITAWTARRNTLCGPDRELKIITVIGPTACGKSYAAHNLLPDSAKCFYGNNGCWFSNADAPSLLIEEFNGQIPLQKLLPFGVQRNSLYQAYCALYEEVKCEGLKLNFSCTSTIPDATHPACTFYTATDRTFSPAEMSRAFPTVAQIMTYGSLQAASAINNSVPKFTRRIYSSDLAEKTTFIDTDYSDHNLTIDGGAALPVTCNDAWVGGGANAVAFAPALFLGVHTNSAVQAAGVSYSFHAEGNFYFTFRTPKYGGAVISAKNIDGEPAEKRVRFDDSVDGEIIHREDTLLDLST